jgi:glutathione S-transferase
MILIGQYDSPFVRRVGITLRLYSLPFEHRPWSVFGDAARIRSLNPLVRVPVLVLPDGSALTDSHVILDYLDSLVPAETALCPRDEPERHRVLGVTALAVGLADKAVGLHYERVMHDRTSQTWEVRCQMQIASVLEMLEEDLARRPGPYWFDRMTHADIALACALRFAKAAHPSVLAAASSPRLAAHAETMEEMPAFLEIYQEFVPPLQTDSRA